MSPPGASEFFPAEGKRCKVARGAALAIGKANDPIVSRVSRRSRLILIAFITQLIANGMVVGS